MSAPLVCDVCEQVPAAMLVTQIEAGDVMALCPYCAPEMLARMARAMSEALAGEPVAATEDGAGPVSVAEDDAGDQAPAARRRQRAGRAEAAAAAAEAQSEPTAAADA